MADRRIRRHQHIDENLSTLGPEVGGRTERDGDAKVGRLQELGNIGFYDGVGGADSAQRRPSIANLLTTSDDRAQAAAAAAASHAGGPPMRPGYGYPYYGYAQYQVQSQGGAQDPAKDAKLEGDKGDPAAQGAAGQFQSFPPVYGYYPQPGANYPGYYYTPNVYQQGAGGAGGGHGQGGQQPGSLGGAGGAGQSGAAQGYANAYQRGFYPGATGFADAGPAPAAQPGPEPQLGPDKQVGADDKKDGDKKKRKSGGTGGGTVGGVQTSVVSADRPYQCPFEGCHWAFARLSDQRRHLRSHQKPTFHCPYWHSDPTCHRNGGAFNRLDVLKRHLRLVHFVQFKQSESGWCRVCQKMFPTPKHFVDHCEKCAQSARPAEWKVDSARMMGGPEGPGGPPDKQLGSDGSQAPGDDATLLTMAEVDMQLKDKDPQGKLGGRSRTRNANLGRQTLSNSIQAGHHLSQA